MPTPRAASPPPRFKDAARECTGALQLAPSSAKALQRRARSLEQQGLYKQALSDIQAVNRCGGGWRVLWGEGVLEGT